MAVLSIQDVTTAGLNPSFVAANVGGDSFPNDGQTSFRIKNGGAASITVTVNSVAPCNYGFDHDIAVTVGIGADITIGPFSKARFNNSAGQVGVTYTDVTSVTVAAIRQVSAPN